MGSMISLAKYITYHSGPALAVGLLNDGIEVASTSLALPADEIAIRDAVDELRAQAAVSGLQIAGRKVTALVDAIATGAVE